MVVREEEGPSLKGVRVCETLSKKEESLLFISQGSFARTVPLPTLCSLPLLCPAWQPWFTRLVGSWSNEARRGTVALVRTSLFDLFLGFWIKARDVRPSRRGRANRGLLDPFVGFEEGK